MYWCIVFFLIGSFSLIYWCIVFFLIGSFSLIYFIFKMYCNLLPDWVLQYDIFYIQDVLYSSWLGPSVWYILYSRCIVFFLIGSFSLIYFIFKMYCILPDWVLQSDIFYIQDVLYPSWLGPSVWYILYSRCIVFFLIGSFSLIYFIFNMYCILPDWVLQSDIFYIQDVLYSSWLGPLVWYILYSRRIVFFLIGSFSLIYFIFKMYCILPDWVLQSDIFYIQDVLYSSWLGPSVWYILYSRCMLFFLIGSFSLIYFIFKMYCILPDWVLQSDIFYIQDVLYSPWFDPSVWYILYSRCIVFFLNGSFSLIYFIFKMYCILPDWVLQSDIFYIQDVLYSSWLGPSVWYILYSRCIVFFLIGSFSLIYCIFKMYCILPDWVLHSDIFYIQDVLYSSWLGPSVWYILYSICIVFFLIGSFNLIYFIFKMYCILRDWVLQSDIFYIQDVLYSSWLGPSVWYILYSRCIAFFLIGSFSLIYFIFKMYCILPDWVLQSDIFYIQDVLYSSWLGPSVWYIWYARCIVFFLIGSFSLIYFIFKMYCILPDWVLQSDIFYIQDVLYSSWLGPSVWYTLYSRCIVFFLIGSFSLIYFIFRMYCILPYWVLQSDIFYIQDVLYSSWLGPSVWYILYSRWIVFFLIGSFSLIYFIFKMYCILPDWVLQSDIFYIQDVLYSSWLGPSVWYTYFIFKMYFILPDWVLQSDIFDIFKMYCILPDWVLQSDIFYIQDVLYSSWLGPSVWYILYSRCIVLFLIGSFSLIYFIFKMYCILPDWVLQSDIFYIQDVLYSSWLGPSVWYILYSRCIVFFLIGSFSLIYFIFKMYCILPDWVLQSDIFYIQDELYSSWLGPSVWYILYSRCIVFFLIGSFSRIYFIFKMYCILPDWVLQSDIFYIQDVLYSSWLGPSVWYILYSRCIVFFLIVSFSPI